MADNPIIFSAPMVRALQDGRKIQTRRVLRIPKWASQNPSDVEVNGDDGSAMVICESTGCQADLPVPYSVGDRLWVRETWRGHCSHDHIAPRDLANGNRAFIVAYVADDDKFEWLGKTRASIHMPRWASRITLTVTDVRVQRLQDISEADAIAEGMPVDHLWNHYTPPPPEIDSWQGYGRASFSLCWSEINGPDSWALNPWIAAYTFTVERRNIDQRMESAA